MCKCSSLLRQFLCAAIRIQQSSGWGFFKDAKWWFTKVIVQSCFIFKVKLRYFNNHITFICAHMQSHYFQSDFAFTVYPVTPHDCGLMCVIPLQLMLKLTPEYSSARKGTLGVVISWELYPLWWTDTMKRAARGTCVSSSLLPHEHRHWTTLEDAPTNLPRLLWCLIQVFCDSSKSRWRQLVDRNYICRNSWYDYKFRLREMTMELALPILLYYC